jgi:hypothetical protein
LLGAFLFGCFAFGSLLLFSYSRVLEFEKQYLPPFETMRAKHQRDLSFNLASIGWWQPHWVLVYREHPITDLRDVDPGIVVSLFGQLLNHPVN